MTNGCNRWGSSSRLSMLKATAVVVYVQELPIKVLVLNLLITICLENLWKLTVRTVLSKSSRGRRHGGARSLETQERRAWQIGRHIKPLISLSGYGARNASKAGGAIFHAELFLLKSGRFLRLAWIAASSGGPRIMTKSRSCS